MALVRVVLAAVVLAAGISGAETARERFERGVRAQRSGDVRAAAAEYREALRLDGKLAAARYLLAVCELQMGNRAEGIALLEAVRTEDPKNAQAAQTLVSVYVAEGLLDRAKTVLDTTLRADRSAGGHLVRGAYALSVADYDRAIAESRAARRLNPRLAGAASQLGVAYCFANRFDEARPVLEAAVAENPRDANAVAFLGWLYKDGGRESEAAEFLAKTVEARPGDTGALFLLAQLVLGRGETAEALGMIERVVGREPGHRAGHVLLARIYHQLGRVEDAERERRVVERLTAEAQAAQPKVK